MFEFFISIYACLTKYETYVTCAAFAVVQFGLQGIAVFCTVHTVHIQLFTAQSNALEEISEGRQ